MGHRNLVWGLFFTVLPSATIAEQGTDLAQQLANPMAAIISVPFQINYDDNLGVDDRGHRTTLNFQPVVPFGLDNGATIVTRTIIPYIWQSDVVPGTSQQGFGDILLNAWYSDTTETGLIWGIGSVVRVPSGSSVSTKTWAAGPTAIALKVSGPWTYGTLMSHMWDVEKKPKTPTNTTLVQPFVAYSTKDKWTFSVSSESAYDWKADEWSVPINASASKLTMVGGVPVNWQGGVGYWATSPDGGAEGWRFRLQAQIVVPKK